jgi:hypothetical protein
MYVCVCVCRYVSACTYTCANMCLGYMHTSINIRTRMQYMHTCIYMHTNMFYSILPGHVNSNFIIKSLCLSVCVCIHACIHTLQGIHVLLAYGLDILAAAQCNFGLSD